MLPFNESVMNCNRLSLWISRGLLVSVILGYAGVMSQPVLATGSTMLSDTTDRESPTTDADYIRPETQCPNELEPLVDLMLRDLPSYANRVNQRSYGDRRTTDTPGYILLANNPDFNPLTLGPGIYSPTDTAAANTPQIFFTTLERQYLDNQQVNIQHHHWLFLTRTVSGWRSVMMLSRLATFPDDQPLSPPQDSSQGVVAQAIDLWLRDCRNGDIFPADP